MKTIEMKFDDDGVWNNEPSDFTVEVFDHKVIHESALEQLDKLLSLRGLELIRFESGGDEVILGITQNADYEEGHKDGVAYRKGKIGGPKRPCTEQYLRGFNSAQ